MRRGRGRGSIDRAPNRTATLRPTKAMETMNTTTETTTLAVHLETLRAFWPLASKDALRPAMNGVLVTWGEGFATYTVTDGHIAMIRRHESSVYDQTEPASLIIPTQTCKDATKGARKNRPDFCPLVIRHDHYTDEHGRIVKSKAQVTIKRPDAGFTFTVMDESYPNIASVIPSEHATGSLSHRVEETRFVPGHTEYLTYSPALLADLHKAASIITGYDGADAILVAANGNRAGTVSVPRDEGTWGLIMPCLADQAPTRIPQYVTASIFPPELVAA